MVRDYDHECDYMNVIEYMNVNVNRLVVHVIVDMSD